MALRRTRPVQGLPGSATGGDAESQSSMIGHINLGAKQAGKPSAGNPHAGFDVAGTGNQPTVPLERHSQRKRGATDRLNLRGNRRQSSTLLMSGEGKQPAAGRPRSSALPRLYRHLHVACMQNACGKLLLQLAKHYDCIPSLKVFIITAVLTPHVRSGFG